MLALTLLCVYLGGIVPAFGYTWLSCRWERWISSGTYSYTGSFMPLVAFWPIFVPLDFIVMSTWSFAILCVKPSLTFTSKVLDGWKMLVFASTRDSDYWRKQMRLLANQWRDSTDPRFVDKMYRATVSAGYPYSARNHFDREYSGYCTSGTKRNDCCVIAWLLENQWDRINSHEACLEKGKGLR